MVQPALSGTLHGINQHSQLPRETHGPTHNDLESLVEKPHVVQLFGQVKTRKAMAQVLHQKVITSARIFSGRVNMGEAYWKNDAHACRN